MSRTAKARGNKNNSSRQVLYVAFELGEKNWHLGFSTGIGQKVREKSINGRDKVAVVREISRAKQRFGLDEDCEVQSVYEAGREGFWLHRFLVSFGVKSIVADSASIEVKRQRRRVKTDRLDLGKLLLLLMRRDAGESRALNPINVPTVDEEDRRQLHREVTKTQHDLNRVTNRIKSLLANHGQTIQLRGDVVSQLDSMRLWDGSPLPAMLRARLEREWAKAEFLREQLKELERQRASYIREGEGETLAQVRKLLQLRGIGLKSSWMYVMEFFGWREFKNGKQVGARAGLAPPPHQSGGLRREHGISKAGNEHIRSMAIEIALCWVHHQPTSALTMWYKRRYGGGGPVAHKIGIVAVARKLLVALWRYLDQDIMPEGALLKGARLY